jgi:hypothetical protein
LNLIWAVPCRDFTLRSDRTADIEGAGVDNIWVGELPAQVRVNVLLQFGLLEGEESQLSIELAGPGGALIGEPLDRSLHGETYPGHRPGYQITRLVPAEFRFMAEQPGVYVAEIRTDNRHQTSLFFVVRDEPPPR